MACPRSNNAKKSDDNIYTCTLGRSNNDKNEFRANSVVFLNLIGKVKCNANIPTKLKIDIKRKSRK